MTTDATEPKKPATRKGRSPNYPGIDLGLAIERARQMYATQRHFDAPVATIVAGWGFTPTSGQGGVVLAALKRFALIEDVGSGASKRAKLTPDALALLRDEREDPTERDKIVQKLALLPSLHRELWAEYEGALPPSDSSLRFDLIHKRGFTEGGADDFIREFRNTVAYAKLDSSGKLSDGDEIDDGERDDPAKPPEVRRRERKPGMTVLSFQISDRLVEVAVPGGPLTKDEIAILREYLTIQERVAPAQRVPEPGAEPATA